MLPSSMWNNDTISCPAQLFPNIIYSKYSVRWWCLLFKGASHKWIRMEKSIVGTLPSFILSAWYITNCVKIVCSSFQSISDPWAHLLQIELSEVDRKEEITQWRTLSNPPKSKWRLRVLDYVWFTFGFPSSKEGRKWLKAVQGVKFPGFKVWPHYLWV